MVFLLLGMKYGNLNVMIYFLFGGSLQKLEWYSDEDDVQMCITKGKEPVSEMK